MCNTRQQVEVAFEGADFDGLGCSAPPYGSPKRHVVRALSRCKSTRSAVSTGRKGTRTRVQPQGTCQNKEHARETFRGKCL